MQTVFNYCVYVELALDLKRKVSGVIILDLNVRF